jgi:hypothetical protein
MLICGVMQISVPVLNPAFSSNRFFNVNLGEATAKLGGV